MASFKELEAGTKEGYRQEEMVEKEFGGAEENEFDETKARRLLRKVDFRLIPVLTVFFFHTPFSKSRATSCSKH